MRMKAAGLALFDFEKLSADVVIGDNGVAGFNDVGSFPVHAMRDESERFLEAGVAGATFLEETAKLFRRKTAADLLLQRSAAGGCVHDALDIDAADIAADTGHANWKHVHDKAGIDARADDARAMVFADFIELR